MLTVLFFGFIAIINAQSSDTLDELKTMNVRKPNLTLSGFSSGGGFAQMLFVAHSSKIHGIAVFSHTYYRCGEPNGNWEEWDRACTSLHDTPPEELYNVERPAKDIKNYFNQGGIDDPKNLTGKKLYVYTGLRNKVFSPVQAMRIVTVFGPLIQVPRRIRSRIQDSTFAMPTDNPNAIDCIEDTTQNHYIGNCRFNGAYEALKFLLCPTFRLIHPKNASELEIQPLRSFNQAKFFDGLKKHQMDDVGYLYIPKGCNDNPNPCLFHVFFHGCGTNRNSSGTDFIQNSGMLEVAEANNIIMLFPQNFEESLVGTAASGCWDTFGLGGLLYATKQGDQLRAVMRMINTVMGDPVD